MLYQFLLKNMEYYRDKLANSSGPIGVKHYKRIVVRLGGTLVQSRGRLNIKHLQFAIPKKRKKSPFLKFSSSGAGNTVDLTHDICLSKEVNLVMHQGEGVQTDSSVCSKGSDNFAINDLANAISEQEIPFTNSNIDSSEIDNRANTDESDSSGGAQLIQPTNTTINNISPSVPTKSNKSKSPTSSNDSLAQGPIASMNKISNWPKSPKGTIEICDTDINPAVPSSNVSKPLSKSPTSSNIKKR